MQYGIYFNMIFSKIIIKLEVGGE